MTTLRALALVAVLVAPMSAQRPYKQPHDRILAEELESYGPASIAEVIGRARPHFLQHDAASSNQMLFGDSRLKVYVGERAIGDTSMLTMYKASDVKEVRWYKESEAHVRFAVEKTTVILLTMKPGPKKKS